MIILSIKYWGGFDMPLFFNRILSLEPFTMFMYIFMFVWAIIFPMIRNILVKMEKSLKIWVICSFIPVVICAVHLLFNLYDKNEAMTFELFGMAYIASLLFPWQQSVHCTSVQWTIQECPWPTAIKPWFVTWKYIIPWTNGKNRIMS